MFSTLLTLKFDEDTTGKKKSQYFVGVHLFLTNFFRGKPTEERGAYPTLFIDEGNHGKDKGKNRSVVFRSRVGRFQQTFSQSMIKTMCVL